MPTATIQSYNYYGNGVPSDTLWNWHITVDPDEYILLSDLIVDLPSGDEWACQYAYLTIYTDVNNPEEPKYPGDGEIKICDVNFDDYATSGIKSHFNKMNIKLQAGRQNMYPYKFRATFTATKFHTEVYQESERNTGTVSTGGGSTCLLNHNFIAAL